MSETCADCGRPVPVRWWAATGLFDAVTAHGPSILCVECFDRRATAKGHRLTWVPLADPEGGDFIEADTTAAFAAWQALPQAERDAREASHERAKSRFVEPEHDLSDDCWCGPTQQPVEREDGSIGWVVVHHTIKGREAEEATP